MRRRPFLIIATVLLVIALVAIAGLVAFLDLGAGAVRRLAVQRLEAITDREVSITGDFDLVPSLAPTLAAQGLTIANAGWGSAPAMLHAERVELELQLLPLLLGRDLLIDRLGLVGAEVLLERAEDGRVNWEFDASAPGPAERQRKFLLNEVSVEDSHLTWHDAASARTETIRVEQLTWRADDLTDRVALAGAGAFRELPFALAGELGAIAALRQGDEPYPIALEVTIAGVEATLEGQLSPAREARLELRVAGESLAGIGELLDRPLPELGPFALEGRLVGPPGELALTDLDGRIGEQGGPSIELIDGRVTDLLNGRGIRLALEARGPSIAALGELVGRELPELGAYEVQGELAGSIEDLALADLTGTIAAQQASNIRITGGRIAHVLAGEGVQVQIAAEGDELARLARALGREMAPFGPYRLEGTLAGSFDSLALRELSATAGDEAARIAVAGTIENALELSGLDLAVTIEGRDLAALSPIARVDLPASEPYRITGDVTGSAADLRIGDLLAELAESSVGGWLAVHRAEPGPPRIEGELNADRLNVDRMLALAGRAGPDEAAALGEEPAAADRIFPAAPLPLQALERIELDLVLRADEVMLDATEFTDASLNLVLQDGRLSVHDIVLQVAGGQVAGDAAVEAESGAAEVMVRLSASDIAIGDLLRDVGATENVTGEIDIDINLDSTGRSIDELMAELEGSAAIAAEEGRIEDSQLDRLVTDLDILRALPPFWRREDDVRVNCLIGEFDIEDGVAETGAMLDTRRMTLLGEGTVDLGEETFDLILRPLAKSQKLSTLAVPVDIEGTFAEPSVRPRTGTAVAQAARGVLGGLLIPLNQIAALFGQDTADACADALRQAQERRERQGPESRSPT